MFGVPYHPKFKEILHHWGRIYKRSEVRLCLSSNPVMERCQFCSWANSWVSAELHYYCGFLNELLTEHFSSWMFSLLFLHLLWPFSMNGFLMSVFLTGHLSNIHKEIPVHNFMSHCYPVSGCLWLSQTSTIVMPFSTELHVVRLPDYNVSRTTQLA